VAGAQRAEPTPLPGGLGVLVYGPDCGLAAGALALLVDVMAGKVPPAAVKAYAGAARLGVLRDAFAVAAREQQAVRHRELAQAQPQTAPIFLAPAQAEGSSLQATITTRQAAEALGITGQQVRVLCSTGRVTAVRGPRLVWEIDPASVAAYADRQAKRRRNSSGRDHAEGRAGGDAGRPEYSAAA